MFCLRNTNLSLLVIVSAITQILLPTSLAFNGPAQSDRRVTIVTQALDIDQILEALARKSGTPTGLEALPCANSLAAKPKISIAIREGTSRDVLDAVVFQDPRYKWEDAEGVINVVPREPCQSILNTLIHRFRIDGTNVQQIADAIVESGEVSGELSQMGIQHLGLRESTGPAGSPVPFSLTFSDASVKNILNEVLRRKIANHWVVERFGENNQYLQIRLSQ